MAVYFVSKLPTTNLQRRDRAGRGQARSHRRLGCRLAIMGSPFRSVATFPTPRLQPGRRAGSLSRRLARVLLLPRPALPSRALVRAGSRAQVMWTVGCERKGGIFACEAGCGPGRGRLVKFSE